MERLYPVRVVSEQYGKDFERIVGELMEKGFEIVSSNCGILHSPDGYSETRYQAILVQERVEIKCISDC